MKSPSPTLNHQPSALVLRSGEIHVCWAFLEQPLFRVQSFAETLSSDERKRAARYHFDKDKKRFTVRRGILRKILGGYLGMRPDQVQLCYGDKGKPALRDNSGKRKICFNLSHSDGLALYVFTCGQEIGVDIEKLRHIADMGQIVERFFSKREKADFCALPQHKKTVAFFNCWTRKEAFLKTIGVGLSHPLDKFDVSLVPGEPARLLRINDDSKEASRWSMYALKTVSNYTAALALQLHGLKIKCWQWMA